MTYERNLHHFINKIHATYLLFNCIHLLQMKMSINLSFILSLKYLSSTIQY